MTAEDFFKQLASVAGDSPERFNEIIERLPLGLDLEKRFVFARNLSTVDMPVGALSRHTCVVGTGRSAFIRRLILTLVGVHDEGKISFVIASPKREYAELLKLKRTDVFIPVLKSVDDLWNVIRVCREQSDLRVGGGEKIYGKLVIVADGLEEFTNGALDCYLPFFSMTKTGAELITGVDLVGSVFSSSPQSFVGNGGCLITVTNRGVADVSRVSLSGELELPTPFEYPSEPSLSEVISLVNEVGE